MAAGQRKNRFAKPPGATIPEEAVACRADERGVALVSVLLLLMMMSALAAALAVSGHTETLIVRNHLSAARAQAAAEAGLNHAVEAATTYISAWRANGFDDVASSLDALLADSSLLDPDITLGVRIPLAGAANVEYEAWIMDEDALAGVGDEDGDPLTDANQRLIIRAAGYAANGSTVLLEAVIAPIPLPAILTNGDLTISGNVTVDGSSGSVHSNGDMTISGNPSISEDATAWGEYDVSGNPSVGGTGTGGAAEVPVTPVQASDYYALATFVLRSTGQLTLPDGTVQCDASGNNNACRGSYGWQFDGPNGWRAENNLADGIWYVEGTVRISSNPGPVFITIIAEGSIEISGNPNLTPHQNGDDLLMVTDGDLKISGGLNIPAGPAELLVHEQVSISGNATIIGRITVEDATSVDTMVEDNTISGKAKITYNGDITSDQFTVTGWRDVRQ